MGITYRLNLIHYYYLWLLMRSCIASTLKWLMSRRLHCTWTRPFRLFDCFFIIVLVLFHLRTFTSLNTIFKMIGYCFYYVSKCEWSLSLYRNLYFIRSIDRVVMFVFFSLRALNRSSFMFHKKITIGQSSTKFDTNWWFPKLAVAFVEQSNLCYNKIAIQKSRF